MATHSIILAGESHGQRSLAGYSPWGCKESDMTERLSTAQHSIKFEMILSLSAESLTGILKELC